MTWSELISLIGPTGPNSGGSLNTGNLIKVDAIYGDDIKASRDPYGLSFKTINAAITSRLTLSNLPMITILVYPGVYKEFFTIPQYTTIQGVNADTVIVSPIINSTMTAVKMSDNSSLRDITINMNT